jgi:hypothetical protein
VQLHYHINLIFFFYICFHFYSSSKTETIFFHLYCCCLWVKKKQKQFKFIQGFVLLFFLFVSQWISVSFIFLGMWKYDEKYEKFYIGMRERERGKTNIFIIFIILQVLSKRGNYLIFFGENVMRKNVSWQEWKR